MFGFSFSYFTAAQLPIPPKNIMLQSVSNTINPRKTSVTKVMTRTHLPLLH